MPLGEMKWRASRGLTFGARESKAPSGLNPGRDSPGRLPQERWDEAGVREESGPGRTEREDGCLGFRITANHCDIEMFTGCGGISCELMIFNIIIFAL